MIKPFCAAWFLRSPLNRLTSLVSQMHVRRADGTLMRGAAAFAEIWNTLPGWRWLARLTRVPGVLPVLDGGYALFLRVRPLWRRPRGGDSGQGT
jgi:predicted DCC family thiol-disulfide oxidoreductase YuxK